MTIDDLKTMVNSKLNNLIKLQQNAQDQGDVTTYTVLDNEITETRTTLVALG